MFVGHFALGFAAKRVAPAIPLAVLFTAAQFADMLWPILLAVGIEQVRIDPGNMAFTPLAFVNYPYSHSLVALLLWAVAFGLLYRVLTGKSGVMVILAALVASHWILDFVVHRADMPLFPGSALFGLGLWNSVIGTLAVELTLFAWGVVVYLRSTTATDGVGRWGAIGLIGLLLAAYGGVAAGGPPTSVTAIWIISLLGIVLILAASTVVDRHRKPVQHLLRHDLP